MQQGQAKGLPLSIPPFKQLKVVFVLKLLYAAAAVDKLLLARKERMACRTNIKADLFVSRSRLKRVTAGAAHLRVFVFRMNTLFHFAFVPFSDLSRTVLFVRYRHAAFFRQP